MEMMEMMEIGMGHLEGGVRVRLAWPA
jgi:hypothetical protein